MPKRRAVYKLSPEDDYKKSRDSADDVVIDVLRDAMDDEDSSNDEHMHQISSAELDFQSRNGNNANGGGSAQSFSSSLDAALRRAAILERRAAREEREEEAMRAAAAVLKAEEDAMAAEAEAEAIAEATRAARIGRRRRISELDVAELMTDGRLAEPRRMHMMVDHEQLFNERGLDGSHRNALSSRRSSMDFTPPLDVAPCPIYDVDVQLRKYVRSDGRQLSHSAVAMAARQNRQKRKEYIKKMEIAYANMQFETQYLRERMSRLQQELKWYKDRWAEHATKCPLLHVGRRQAAMKDSASGANAVGVSNDSMSQIAVK